MNCNQTPLPEIAQDTCIVTVFKAVIVALGLLKIYSIFFSKSFLHVEVSASFLYYMLFIC